MLIKISANCVLLIVFCFLFVIKILHCKGMNFFLMCKFFFKKITQFFYSINKNEFRIWRIAENFLNLQYES